MIRAALLTAILAVSASGAQAQAQSKAVAYLVKQEIAEGCETHRGTMATSGIIERDLDGDGVPDLILADDALKCSGPSARSLNCGMQICSVTFYLRRGPLLQKVHEMLGAGVTVGAGRIPKVSMFAHGGSRGFVRWNGQAFSNR